MAERYETKAPVHFTRDGTVTLQQDQGGVYEEMSSKKDPQQTEESTYTNLQFGETQPTNSSSSSSSNGGAQVGVVRSKTNTKIFIAIAIVFTACVILVAFALIMAGVTLSSSKDSTRSSALIESLESQVTQLREEQQDSTRSSALIESLTGQLTQLRAEFRQELNSMRSTLAVAQHSFNTSLHTPLHPYQNCRTDTTENRIPPTTGTYYTRRVYTNYLSINVTVSHIQALNFRCKRCILYICRATTHWTSAATTRLAPVPTQW